MTDAAGTAPVIDIQPVTALVAGVVLAVIGAVVSDATLLWLLAALGIAVGAWFAYSQKAKWPSDVEQLLGRYRLTRVQAASPQPAHGSQPSSASATTDEQVIPFRGMTFPEIITGSVKVVLRSWPSLLGIPIVILVGFVLVLYVVLMVMMQVMFAASTSMVGNGFVSTSSTVATIGGLFAMLAVMYVLAIAVAFPADALLIALSVLATDRAVRGVPVRLGEVFAEARQRMFAVFRLTAALYLILFTPDVLLVAVGVAARNAGVVMVFALLMTVAIFVVGILLSLAPIVLMKEGLGVAASFRRSVELTKSAWPRLLGIHALWFVVVFPLALLVSALGFSIILWAVILGALIAVFRCMQVLIYTDLRMRQENYAAELSADWERNASGA
ncbi:hypothetical protein [Gordonia rhizosphera]|uniref:Uncharacterized protein n=1 Tax=Gordonia rhizosphera NBRC 16068 TaxID=1108045 RepID=K6V252_9ACTN|nr:hypothetical protein [Gordonia rhizosphera]GAB90063.1 hypothetical protein GORHZ_083_00060 [Gordonia rhizosphera NBRC 16068]